MEIKLFEPFFKITDKQAKSFKKELKKEMPNGHILKKEKFNCIARRDRRATRKVEEDFG